MLALAVGMNKRYSLALRHAERSGRPLADVETSFVGTSHVAVGAYLASVWGLPAVVVDSIERHHEDDPVSEDHAEVVVAVRLAQRAAECIEKGDHTFEGAGLSDEQIERIDTEFALTEIMPKSREPLLAI
jgi:HD-like signal output (HDOD) protein